MTHKAILKWDIFSDVRVFVCNCGRRFTLANQRHEEKMKQHHGHSWFSGQLIWAATDNLEKWDDKSDDTSDT